MHFPGFRGFGPRGRHPRDPRDPLPDPHDDTGPIPPYHYVERCDAVVHSLFREWSANGKKEREESFEPILKELSRLLPIADAKMAYTHNVVLPGCGLGRLGVEISRLGYNCEINEFSVFMLLTLHYMVNGGIPAEHHRLCPWLGARSNVVTLNDTLLDCRVPDIPCMELLNSGPYIDSYVPPTDEEVMSRKRVPNFSMRAGDFVDIYGQAEHANAWHAVVTCWFIDAVPNVVDLIHVIHGMLAPGGCWINMGPLLYHWVVDAYNNNDPRYRSSIALPWEDIKAVVDSYPDLTFQTDEWRKATYVARPCTMQHTSYDCKFFSVTKTAA